MPKDPVMLLSYVNTQLRAAIDYEYDAVRNQFI